MTTLSYVTLDPRPQSREQEIARLRELRESGAFVWGIEVTVLELAAECSMNTDPQHASESAACGAIEEVEQYLRSVDLSSHEHIVLATIRRDADSVGAMAVVLMKISGDPFDHRTMARIQVNISAEDSFLHGEWPGRRALEITEISWQFKALSALVSNPRLPLEEAVAHMRDYLLTGDCQGLIELISSLQEEWRQAIMTSGIDLAADNRIAVVETTVRMGTDLAYRYAPVAVLVNPHFSFGGGPEHLKYTVCAYQPHYVDFQGLLTALRGREPGWGGNVTSGILGSPQGVSSQLTKDEVISLVEESLRENVE
jgi:hypothetical protein